MALVILDMHSQGESQKKKIGLEEISSLNHVQHFCSKK
jgi:hypothetical protein